MSGMLSSWNELVAALLGSQPRSTPSELTEQAYPDIYAKTKIKMPTEEFLSAPVTDLERDILRLAPRGMLYDLNKQGLDRELESSRRFFSRNRGKPIAM